MVSGFASWQGVGLLTGALPSLVVGIGQWVYTVSTLADLGDVAV